MTGPLVRARLAPVLAALLAGLAAGCATASRRPAPAGGDLPATAARALDRLLDSRPFDRVLWGVAFVDVRSGRTLYERNADRHFVAASTMKLIVAATALDKLGPDYTYRTSLYTNGRIEDGTLRGDLILYGRGDPNLSGRYTTSPTAIFEELADSLKSRGIRRVAGRVVADESYFDADYTRPDWEAYDLLWWYAAPVSALSFNDNSIDLTVRPGAPGLPPVITASPVSRFYTLLNTARTVPRLDSAGASLDFTRVPGTNRIIAYGELPTDADQDTEYFAVVNPAAYAGTVFLETLGAAGIAVADDSVAVVSDPARSPVDSTSTLLAEHVSPPLEAVIFSINRRSQNWHAEQLLKTLGKVLRGRGSFDAGIAVELAFLDSLGVARDAIRIRDASGLSTGNLVTPRSQIELLRHMLRHPQGGVFVASLPTPGGDGSLRTRLSNLPTGAVHAKTGSIENVSSLVGYLVPAPADTVAFSILANNHGLEGGQVMAAIDSAVTSVANAYRR